MIFRAGLALNTVGSFVNGLMPFRAFVAGFLMTINLAKSGTKNAPVFLSSCSRFQRGDHTQLKVRKACNGETRWTLNETTADIIRELARTGA
jgi:hypothetical protein